MSKFSTEEKVRIVLDGMRYPEGVTLYSGLVYVVTKGDGSGYNRKNGVQLNSKSKVEGAITNEEYRSPEA